MEKKQQYKWRKRKQQQVILTIWLVAVGVLSIGAAFLYEGMKESSSLKEAQRYIEETKDLTSFSLKAGERSLNKNGLLTQEYSVTYKKDGEETESKEELEVVRLEQKKFGLFERWQVNEEGSKVEDFQLIVPAGSKMWLDQEALGTDLIYKKDTLEKGSVCYVIPQLEAKKYTISRTGFPYESFEEEVDVQEGSADFLAKGEFSENAKAQMQEIGKEAIQTLFMAAFQKKAANTLDAKWSQTEGMDKQLAGLTENLNSVDGLTVKSIDFEIEETKYKEPRYSDIAGDNWVEQDITLKYQCQYTGERTSEEETKEESKSSSKKATFCFRFENGNCTLKSLEVPNIL